MLSIKSAQRLVGFNRPTVWMEFTPLAVQCKAVNLGQGFPDWQAPDFCKELMTKAVNDNFNQYCRAAGESNLVKAIAEKYSVSFSRQIDPLTEVSVGVGATECLFAIMQAYIEDGDEVIMLEPTFDIYPAQVQMAGGKSVQVSLTPPANGSNEWTMDFAALEASITPKTKILLLNTPHNPTGMVLSRDSLVKVSEILLRHPHVMAVTDGVYEHIVYSPKGHTDLASLPGMWDRTITVSSAGKTFSITGWKVGWAVGPKELITPINLTNQWVQYSISTPTSKAVADVFEAAKTPYKDSSDYYSYLRDSYTSKMQLLVNYAREAGLKPLEPEGSFFLLCDTSDIELPANYRGLTFEDGEPLSHDWAFCRWLTKEIGVAAIPVSVFFSPERKHLAANMIRLCFCKEDETIHEAGRRLKSLLKFRRE